MTRAEAEQAIAAGEDARRVVSILDELAARDAASTAQLERVALVVVEELDP